MRTLTRIALFTLFLGLIVGCHPKPVKTIENLKAACSLESTASAKYAAFAEKAKAEGFDTVAIMFTALSKSEAIHSANHMNVLQKLGAKAEELPIGKFDVLSTKENLAAEIKGETHEVETMYPGFIGTAKKERCAEGVKAFTRAFSTEKKHLEFNSDALTSLNGQGEITIPAGWFVCPVCGNTYNNTSVTATCDLCMNTPDNFLVFN
jgi:rubrerythrin